MPATREDLVAIGNGRALPEARTVIFCTEDAILESEVPLALERLKATLPALEKTSSATVGSCPVPFRCIRPRSPKVMRHILDMEGFGAVNAVVLPKVCSRTLSEWETLLLPYPDLGIMISLETADVFDSDSMRRLRDQMLGSPLRNRIICLRTGGLDLLNILALRRSCRRTIYDTPVGSCIKRLITLFVPAGFSLSAPAFECLNNHPMLREELEMDILNGLFCKTALHPDQLNIIHDAYRVAHKDRDMAEALLDPKRPAVFSMHGRMCEKATHQEWAGQILARAEIYGTTPM